MNEVKPYLIYQIHPRRCLTKIPPEPSLSVHEPTLGLENPSLIELGSSPVREPRSRQSLGTLSLMHIPRLVYVPNETERSGVSVSSRPLNVVAGHEAKPAGEWLDKSDVWKMH